MKTLPLLVIPLLAWMQPAFAETPAKPVVSLSAKTKVLDSDSDLRGKRGSRKEKTITLRVEITNTSTSTVEGAQLDGKALVKRSGDLKDKLILESLGSAKLETLKPNQKITVDLGSITLHELEWRARKFEETLEAWQVVCTRGGIEIGKAESEHYQKLEMNAVAPPSGKKPVKPKRRP